MNDVVWLSRLQFAITIGFHFAFVVISLGMVWPLFIIETMAWRTKNRVWERAGKFFGKILGITFVFGVVSGIVMEFQFGTNWGAYSNFVGDIFGTPLAAEGIFTFFLESVFIGLYIFGRDKIPKGVHWFSILMVATGATFSAFWILVANSWMQSPTGYAVQEGRLVLTNFRQVIFNKAVLPQFLHTVDGILIGGAFFMAGVTAWMVLKNKEMELAKKVLKMSMIFGLITSILELYPFGDMSARRVAESQPTKFAAMESVEKTRSRASLVLFGLPIENPPHLIMDVRAPAVLSWLAFRDADATVKGFDSFAADDLPPFILTFTSFHLMVALGTLFIAEMIFGTFLLWRGTLWQNKWFLWILVASVPLPIIACQFGWMTAEIGRQPWIVYGVLKTAQAASVNITSGEVMVSLLLFSGLYISAWNYIRGVNYFERQARS